MSGRLIISSKKSWHVWRADNVERVEKDEALAAEAKTEEDKRARVADGEARLALLRKRAHQLRGGGVEQKPHEHEPVMQEVGVEAVQQGPLDLFQDQAMEDVLLGGARVIESASRERRLGPNNEQSNKAAVPAPSAEEQFGAVEKQVPWYAGGEAKKNEKREKADARTKEREDPLFVMSVARDATKQLEVLKSTRTSLDQALVDAHKRTRDARFDDRGSKGKEKESEGGKKSKKKEKKKHKKQIRIDELRAERLRREAAEHERAKQLLQPAVTVPRVSGGRMHSPRRYNSGFSRK